MPVAGWIGPDLRPCTAADVIREEIPADPCRCRYKPSSRQDARAMPGAGFPVAGRAAELMRTPPKRAPCRSRLFGAVRDRPDACQLTDRITFGDRGVLEDARTSADLHALVPGSSAVGGEAE